MNITDNTELKASGQIVGVRKLVVEDCQEYGTLSQKDPKSTAIDEQASKRARILYIPDLVKKVGPLCKWKTEEEEHSET